MLELFVNCIVFRPLYRVIFIFLVSPRRFRAINKLTCVVHALKTWLLLLSSQIRHGQFRRILSASKWLKKRTFSITTVLQPCEEQFTCNEWRLRGSVNTKCVCNLSAIKLQLLPLFIDYVKTPEMLFLWNFYEHIRDNFSIKTTPGTTQFRPYCTHLIKNVVGPRITELTRETNHRFQITEILLYHLKTNIVLKTNKSIN